MYIERPSVKQEAWAGGPPGLPHRDLQKMKIPHPPRVTPSHFHVRCGDQKAMVTIDTLGVLRGRP